MACENQRGKEKDFRGFSPQDSLNTYWEGWKQTALNGCAQLQPLMKVLKGCASQQIGYPVLL